MIVRHTKITEEPTLILGDHEIGLVHCYEYLGMLLDDKLAMNDYVDTMWKKATSISEKLCFRSSGWVGQWDFFFSFLQKN